MQNKQYTMQEMYPLLLEVIESGGEFRLWPRGTSMMPLLRQGKDSVLLVSPHHLQKRDICLYRRADGSFVLHRLMKFAKNGAPVFCGDNQTAFEYGVPRESIIARVCDVYRGDRRISVGSKKYRLYVFFHCIMPLRFLRFLPRRAWGRLKRIFKK